MFTSANFIFIAGPVVAMPLEKIKFQTVHPPNINFMNAEWCVTKNGVTTKLEFKAPGYSIKTGGSQPITQKLEI